MNNTETPRKRELFRMHVIDDRMEPRWSNGDYIECHWLDDDEPLPVGQDVIVLTARANYFKRLEAVDGETLTLRALNPNYPDPIILPRGKVLRVAEAVYKLTNPSNPRVAIGGAQ